MLAEREGSMARRLDVEWQVEWRVKPVGVYTPRPQPQLAALGVCEAPHRRGGGGWGGGGGAVIL